MAMTTEEWIDELKAISVLELSERIKALEAQYGPRWTPAPAFVRAAKALAATAQDTAAKQ